MAHLSEAELVRATGAGRAEIERAAAHLATCPACRALAAGLLHDRTLPATRQVPLRTLLELAGFERQAAIERLMARAELADLRRQSRAAQKERVAFRSRTSHTSVFVDLLLAALRAPQPKDEAEFLSSLAVLAAQRMEEKRNTAAFKNDLLGMVWTETANARRIHGEWTHAQAALLRAEQHLASGTASPYGKARWLSILASLRIDQGARAEGMAHLEECRGLYEREGDWPLVARTVIKMAYCLVDDDPERSLVLLNQANVLVPAADATLLWHVLSLRTECFINLRRMDDALGAFREAERLRPLQHQPRARLRASFTAGRLLEALGRAREAEPLFDEALSGDLHHGLYKDALLDLLYFFGFLVRLSAAQRAVDLSLRTLAEIERQDSMIHEQLRSVWTSLIDAAREQSLDERTLEETREYLRTHWKYPAPSAPAFAHEERLPATPSLALPVRDEKLVTPLLTRALWSRLRSETRRRQQEEVADSPECHTEGFAELLLAELRAAPSRDEAEFIASLALRAAEGIAAPAAFREDFLAQVWTEIANVRRIAAEWTHARAALRKAGEHLSKGSGDALPAGRRQSIAASLSADQGRRSEAVAILEHCVALYEKEEAWPLVARTIVKMAHVLIDIEPERALALAEKALPLIPAHDAVLRWLAESIRTESLIELGQIGRALQAFQIAESLRASQARADAGRRSNFTAARLLEALGYLREAEQLFEAVIAEGFEREAYREAFLDILYLFGLHIRRGSTEKAVALCRFAIARLDLFDVGHEQLRTVWVELRDAAMRRAIRVESLAEVREFVQVHWKTPAAKVPRFSLR
jgi:tetratricopeptide (TPR) repeat protein